MESMEQANDGNRVNTMNGVGVKYIDFQDFQDGFPGLKVSEPVDLEVFGGLSNDIPDITSIMAGANA